MEDVAVRIGRWMTSRDTGVSSSAIAAATLGAVPTDRFANTPSDGDDFGRCYRLIALIPEARQGVHRLALRSAQWARLDAIWHELEALYVQKDGKELYKRIEAANNPLNLRSYKYDQNADGLWDIRALRSDESGGTFRLGGNVKISTP